MKALAWLAIAGLLLSGCATTPEAFEAVREGVKGSPALRKALVDSCTRDMKLTPDERRMGAALMNIASERDVERTACSRITAGFVAGKLTHQDIYSRPIRLTPRLVRVLQDR